MTETRIITEDTLKRWFAFPIPETVFFVTPCQTIQDGAKEFATTLLKEMPLGPHREIAIQKLREVVMVAVESVIIESEGGGYVQC